MTIERFTKDQFERALGGIHVGCESLGIEHGEETYAVPVTANARILVRSSVDSSGRAADTGDDSIRLYIQILKPDYRQPTAPLVWAACGKKVDAYTQRTPGWADRMESKIRQLFERARLVLSPAHICPVCGRAPWTGFVKSGANEGRPYASCSGTSNKMHHFQWLDEEATGVIEFDAPEPGELAPDTPVEPKVDKVKPVLTARTDAEIDSKALKQHLKAAKAAKAGKEVEPVTYACQPNDSQLAVIEAPVDASIRLMAPPGSGKTFVIEHRYQHLVAQGENPAGILVVTFSKKMADEMLTRIKATCPQAQDNQISTIHALCFRILSFWDATSPYYGWQVAKDWQLKKVIDEAVERIWIVDEERDEMKPGWAEIMTWIGNCKFKGISDAKEQLAYYTRNLGARFGQWLHQIHNELDLYMVNASLLTFGDMVYLMERRLIEDAGFRSYWQSRFNHIIVDEAQDTSAQALRVLITLSLEPGSNRVYETLEMR